MSRRIQHGDWALEWLQYPSYEPLTLSQAKQQLGITDDQTDFDALIGGTGAGDGYISVARSYIEETYGLPILKQRVRLTLAQFPWADTIRIPIWPVQSVDAFTYVTSDSIKHTLTVGENTTIPIPNVLTRLSRKPAELILPFAVIWPPAVLQTAEAIAIDMTVGFINGLSPETLPIPSVVFQAMRLLIGHYFMNREAATVIGRPSEALVLGIDNLMANVRLHF